MLRKAASHIAHSGGPALSVEFSLDQTELPRIKSPAQPKTQQKRRRQQGPSLILFKQNPAPLPESHHASHAETVSVTNTKLLSDPVRLHLSKLAPVLFVVISFLLCVLIGAGSSSAGSTQKQVVVPLYSASTCTSTTLSSQIRWHNRRFFSLFSPSLQLQWWTLPGGEKTLDLFDICYMEALW